MAPERLLKLMIFDRRKQNHLEVWGKGRDIHPPDAITSNLPPEKHLGPVDPSTVKEAPKELTAEQKQREERSRFKPPLDECLNLHDFEAVAKATLPDKAWAYYSSAADDEITHRDNRAAFQRIWFRPRILRDVTHVDWYVNKDRAKTKKIVQHAEKRGVKALFITVDAPQLGRREKDMRMKFEDVGAAVQAKSDDKVDRNQGALLKDAVLAAEAGCDGIVLSNHGGRQLDTTRSGIEILPEVVDELRKRGLFPNPKFSIFVDGGVRRATDVLKAVALGATAVGVGRAFIYAFSAYGQEGVEKAFKILHDEFEMNMRLIGARNLKEVVPSMVDTSSLNLHVTTVPEDRLYRGNSSANGSIIRADEAMRGAAVREVVKSKL
ncbi:hypothetical protein FRC00_012790 [Tulasnella sp. 408]|nr:hypothetical protein FRC00_012790 [Tulasnella sp. 408]